MSDDPMSDAPMSDVRTAPSLPYALMVCIDAAPGRDDEVAGLLQACAGLAREEPGTLAWYGLRFGRGEYGIFGAFADEAARDAHRHGSAGRALADAGDALASAPTVEAVRILAHKTPMTRETVAKGLLLGFPARDGRGQDVEQVLCDALPIVEGEPRTIAWFAIQRGNGDYGVLDVFADNAGRFAHLAGQLPRELARHSLELFGGVPEVHLLDVLAELAVVAEPDPVAAEDEVTASDAAGAVVPGALGLAPSG